MRQTTAINVRDVPEQYRRTVEAMAASRNVPVNDVLTESLARYYGVAWEPSGYPFAATHADSTQWVIRLPESLKLLVSEHAKNSGNTMRGIVLLVVARRFGLSEESPRSRRVQLDDDLIREARARHVEGGESIRSLAREYRVKRETLTKAIRAA